MDKKKLDSFKKRLETRQQELRRMVTRSLAIIPAALTIYFAGEQSTLWLLLLSQCVLSMQLPFAIIPLIYTIADDALSTVPEHLRSASLGAGATPWQTAVRIVIPTAASGLFSALMIGLGRAVGETMIVLMAAGNTPVMNWMLNVNISVLPQT